MGIRVHVDHGGQFTNAADIERAREAAETVLAEFDHGGFPQRINAAEAYAAWTRHLDNGEYIRSPGETLLIAAWEAADSAANIALTEGWASPNGAYCSITAD